MVEPEPAVFVAVTVYVVAPDATVGVPVTAPVVALKLKPLGRLGEIVQDDASPAVFVGTRDGIVAFNASDTVAGEYEITGAVNDHVTVALELYPFEDI